MLSAGTKAPDFHLQDQHGKTHALSDFLGQKLVIYFYPKDNTPGCTTEACQFRDHHQDFVDKNVQIIGISKDSASSHLKFAEKFDLPFLLLADPQAEALEAYGVWGEKKLYGKTFLGITRSSFLIDEAGMIVKVYPKVKVKEHAAEILAFLA